LGDNAIRHPISTMLAQAFPGRVQVGDIGTVAAAAATYSGWLERKSEASANQLSYYLTPYEAPSVGALDWLDGKDPGPPVVTNVTIEEAAAPPSAGGAAPASASANGPMTGEASASAGSESANTVAAAKDLIERGRGLIEEAGR